MRRFIQLLNKHKLRLPYSKIVFTLSTFLAVNAFTALPSKAAIEFTGDIDTLVDTVIEGAANSMGKVAGTGKIKWAWCEDTYYNSISKTICLEPKFMKELGKAGKAAISFVVAHEYAHHVQYATSKLISNAQRNTMRLELQADCYAGIILASTDNISFNLDEVQTMIAAAYSVGDQAYDDFNHHGPGENRALALRSGLRYGSSKGKIKDAYYKMFCLGK